METLSPGVLGEEGAGWWGWGGGREMSGVAVVRAGSCKFKKKKILLPMKRRNSLPFCSDAMLLQHPGEKGCLL